MTRLLISTEELNRKTEYVLRDVFNSVLIRIIGSLNVTNLYVESPFHTYASVICRQRAHWRS